MTHYSSQQNPTRSCFQTLAGSLTIPATLLLIIAITITHWRFTWLNPSYLKQILIQLRIYEELPATMLDGLLEQAIISSGEPEWIAALENAVGKDVLENLTGIIFPPAWFQEQVEGNIEAVFDYLDGGTPYPYLELRTSTLRENLTGEAMQTALRDLVTTLPPCDLESILNSSQIPNCRPPDFLLDALLAEITQNLTLMVPADITFRAIIDGSTRSEAETLSQFGRVQRGYQFLGRVIFGAWFGYFILMVIIILLAARNLASALSWIGWPALIGSGISLVIFGAALTIFPILVEYWIAQLPPSSVSGLATGFGSLIFACNEAIQKLGLLMAGILTIFSAMLIVGSAILHRLQLEMPKDRPQ